MGSIPAPETVDRWLRQAQAADAAEIKANGFTVVPSRTALVHQIVALIAPKP